jgi:ferredoxin
MASLTLGDVAVDITEGQTVLAALLAAGVDAPYSCREGICLTCLHQAIEGTVPESAQIGLSDTQKEQGYFMACVCVPKESLKIVRAGDLHGRLGVNVTAIDRLSPSVIRLKLKPDGAFPYRPGQFLALTAPGGITRNYSIASQPDVDGFIELHVRILQGGRMSGLIAELIYSCLRQDRSSSPASTRLRARRMRWREWRALTSPLRFDASKVRQGEIFS